MTFYKGLDTAICCMFQRWHKDISGLREDHEFAFDDVFYEEILIKTQEFESRSPEEHVSKVFNSESLNKKLSFEDASKAIG